MKNMENPSSHAARLEAYHRISAAARATAAVLDSAKTTVAAHWCDALRAMDAAGIGLDVSGNGLDKNMIKVIRSAVLAQLHADKCAAEWCDSYTSLVNVYEDAENVTDAAAKL